MTHPIVLPALLAVLFVATTVAQRSRGAEAQAEIFRISQPSESTILELTRQGWLTWTNPASAAPAAPYVVERTRALDFTAWNPLLRSTSSGSQTSVQVTDPSPPHDMIFLPGGDFRMGDTFGEYSAATPIRTVTLDPFYMKRHEVTNEELRIVFQWAFGQGLITVTERGVESTSGATNVLLPLGRFAQEVTYNDGTFGVRSGREDHPVAYLTWYGAAAFCNYLSLMEGLEVCYNLALWTCNFSRASYRLPTEAEWEYAARGAFEGHRFPWFHTDEITHSLANYRSSTNNAFDVSPTRGLHPDYDDQRPNSSPVGSFAPNNFGLHDMSGNVWEWVWDWWGGRYPRNDEVNPRGVPTGSLRIFRGGSWLTTAERLTCAVRYPDQPDDSTEDVGFRYVRPAARQPTEARR